MFQGKKITVVGLGLLGRGLGDIRYLAEMGAEITVTDMKSPEQLKESLDALSQYSNIRYTLGEHRLEDFRGRDLILKAPKMPLDSPYIAEAKKNGIPVTMSAALFVRLSQIKVVGITGTRGKTTTTYLIAEGLKQAGYKVLLGGNIQGVSTLALLPTVTPDTIAVLELDSWQLQGFREEGISPHVSVFTTFFPDHMDYYHNDMDAYLADKAEIFLHQTEGDILVAGEQVATILSQKYGQQIRSKVEVAKTQDFPAQVELKIPGDHNRYNAACALKALHALGIDSGTSLTALATFEGVQGRLQFVREVAGIKIYNDTNATTPEATLAALNALDMGVNNIVLIMGGYDKGLDMTVLAAKAATVCKDVILLAGTGTSALQANGMLQHCNVCGSLEEAVRKAIGAASKGDTVIFSPAFASFGMFRNEYDRGDQFLALVQKL